MEKIFTSRKFKFLCLFVLALVFFTIGFLGLAPANRAKAYQLSDGIEALLPASDVEQYDLSAPIDAVKGGDVTAIIQRDNKTLLIHTPRLGFVTISGTNLSQVKMLNSSTLIVSNQAIIYFVDVNNITSDILTDYEHNNPFGATCVDLNERYIATSFGLNVLVHELSNGVVGEQVNADKDIFISRNAPVAINDNDEIFYIQGDSIYSIWKVSINDDWQKTELVSGLTVKPTGIIANDDLVYFVAGSSVYRMTTEGENFKALTVDGDARYDLGNLIAPTGVSFYGENLLISDPTVGAVQEFAVDSDMLKFTGYAIAKGKTAFNRISANATEIEHYKDLTAVLDENKLTVISTPEGFNSYDKANFKNYLKEDMGFADASFATLPNAFALGNNTALLNFDTNTVKILNLSPMADEQELTFVSGIKTVDTVKDVCYQSGYYYLVATDATNSTVYKIDEKTAAITEKLDFSGIIAELLTVSVRGDIYLADGTTIYLNDTSTQVCTRNSASKLATDLAGNLFALANGSAMQLIGGALTTTAGLNSMQALSIGFDTEKAFYLLSGNESIFATTLIGNVGVDSLSVPDGYKVTDLNSTADTLDVWTADEGTNVYAVSTTGEPLTFEFKDLAESEEEYALLGKITAQQSADGNVVFYALATPHGTVLIDEADLTHKDKTWSDAPESAYVTTDACAYYLPVISAPDTYALTKTIDDDGKIRLPKGTVIYPDSATGKITHLGKEFYLAVFEDNGETRQGYVPVSFTVETPYVTSGYTSYTLEKVSGTNVYAENSLDTGVATLSDGATVRLYKTENGVALIGYQLQDGSWLTGYVKASALQNTPNLVVRNVLIILLVVASVAGSATFFILRKKKS